MKLDEENAPLGYLCVPSWNGTFDGKGHVIKGAIYETSGFSDGLFRFVGENDLLSWQIDCRGQERVPQRRRK